MLVFLCLFGCGKKRNADDVALLKDANIDVSFYELIDVATFFDFDFFTIESIDDLHDHYGECKYVNDIYDLGKSEDGKESYYSHTCVYEVDNQLKIIFSVSYTGNGFFVSYDCGSKSASKIENNENYLVTEKSVKKVFNEDNSAKENVIKKIKTYSDMVKYMGTPGLLVRYGQEGGPGVVDRYYFDVEWYCPDLDKTVSARFFCETGEVMQIKAGRSEYCNSIRII